MRSYTFVIEIDRGNEQERLRWRWREENINVDINNVNTDTPDDLDVDTKTNTNNVDGNRRTVAGELIRYLDAHLQKPLALKQTYSVEMHQPSLGWTPLTKSTPSAMVPKNCKVNVTFPKKAAAAPSSDAPAGEQTRGRTAVAKPVATNAALPAREFNSSSSRDNDNAATVEGQERGWDRDAQVLALPWRRFDRDLDGGGFEILGRNLVVGGVPNSDEGTGLFTWDGSVLLAKYIEHQVAVNTTSNANSIFGTTEKLRAIRVLELGCGTGLAGLAAAFAFGGRRGGGDHNGPLPPHAARLPSTEVEVVLTDLSYALNNARDNIVSNTESLEVVRAGVTATELDWCQPLPQELIGGHEFDLILAADVVWLDNLVDPLVRTLERLTEGWCGGGDRGGCGRGDEDCSKEGNGSRRGGEAAMPKERHEEEEEEEEEEESSGLGLGPVFLPESNFRTDDTAGHDPVVETGRQQSESAQTFPEKAEKSASSSANDIENGLQNGQRRRCWRWRRRRRVLLAYQWRSERTGRALLAELDKAFEVREIPPEECHPDYSPSRSLCLYEVVRRRQRL